MFGKSLWSLSLGFLLQEETLGTGANRQLRKEFCEANKDLPITSFAALLSYRAEKTTSIEQYSSATKFILADELSPPARSFLTLLVSPYPCKLVGEIQELLNFVEVLPLADRYEMFCRLTLCAIVRSHPDTRRLTKALQSLCSYVQDPVIVCATETLSTHPFKGLPAANITLQRSWDHYVTGDYTESAGLARSVARSHPLVFQAHELLTKTCLY